METLDGGGRNGAAPNGSTSGGVGAVRSTSSEFWSFWLTFDPNSVWVSPCRGSNGIPLESRLSWELRKLNRCWLPGLDLIEFELELLLRDERELLLLLLLLLRPPEDVRDDLRRPPTVLTTWGRLLVGTAVEWKNKKTVKRGKSWSLSHSSTILS